MKNKEKYASKIIEIACSRNELAVSEATGEPIECNNTTCKECLLHEKNGEECSVEYLREWAESEYIEQPVISKRDREFLEEYLGKELKYIVRSKSDKLIAYQHIAEKSEDGWVYVSGMIKSLCRLNLNFPMVKWSDGSPWLIEDLKKLEVVEEYE